MKTILTVWAVCGIGVMVVANGCATANTNAVARNDKEMPAANHGQTHTVTLKNCERELVLLPRGDEIAFKVYAGSNGHVRWFFRGKLLDCEGNTLQRPINIKTLGLYRARVFENHIVHNYEADLQMYSGGRPRMLSAMSGSFSSVADTNREPIILTGIPAAPGGTIGTCPGKFKSSVSFGLPMPTFGWTPLSGGGTAANNTGVNAKIQGGNLDGNCGDCALNTIMLNCTNACRFTLYFPNSTPSSASIKLTNFQ